MSEYATSFKPTLGLQYTWPGLIITLIGIPIYYLAVSNKNKENPS